MVGGRADERVDGPLYEVGRRAGGLAGSQVGVQYVVCGR